MLWLFDVTKQKDFQRMVTTMSVRTKNFLKELAHAIALYGKAIENEHN